MKKIIINGAVILKHGIVHENILIKDGFVEGFTKDNTVG